MIGGEFSIELTDILSSVKNVKIESCVYRYASGRAALYQILKLLRNLRGVSCVLLPDYICPSVLVPVKVLGLGFSFYSVNDVLELDEDAFISQYKPGVAVLIVNYFGLKDLSRQVSFIKQLDKEAIIIEDDVQAYYEFKKPLGVVDFKYTSLRKTFAIPDGGLVKTNYRLPIIDTTNNFGQYKSVAALLKSMPKGFITDQIYLKIFEKGEGIINDELEYGMSLIATDLFNSLDEEQVKRRRLSNALYVIERLKKIGIVPLIPLNEGYVPLFIPIILKERDRIRNAMFKHEIFCPVHWPVEGMYLKRGKEMADTELSLIVDQRYGQKDMDEILKVLQ